MRLSALLAAASLLLASPLLVPSTAEACGGVFCDIPPPDQPPMPVDQSGENVLFVVKDNRVEAHVNIQYVGNPARFAWVVPMPKKPTITAGSQRLFDNLLQATVPTFDVDSRGATNCRSQSFDNDSVGCGSSTSDEASASPDFAPTRDGLPGQGGASSGPNVIARASVGSYETVTLDGGTAEELAAWLKNNNYLMPDTTTAFLKDYLEQKYVFVAVKLTAGADLNEIHPLVFTYEGDQPCVPLKLTAVAALQNMGVRTFFLGKDRFAPKNYKHVVVNDLLFDWTAASGGVSNNFFPNPGTTSSPTRQINYNEIITKAVDSPLANGRAFVTEYAGTSGVVARGIADFRWSSKPFRTANPTAAIQLLKEQELLDCDSISACTSPSPLLFPLLAQLLPPPPGKTQSQYYSDPEGSSGYIPAGWSGDFFANELDERIILPARHADKILAENQFLTRMFTTISPNEMTEDPEFVRTKNEGVSQNRSAILQRQCDNTQTMIVGANEVHLANDASQWPALPAAMPAALRVEEFNDQGERIELRDNSAEIQAQLAAFNGARNWPPPAEFAVDDESNCTVGFGPVRNRTTAAGLVALAGVALALRRRRRPAG
ncbi:MAG: DUF2330 domain-containing protein [Polyangiaceae bacterium]|jgi:hypothetical protein|nr:DUF2330 domain-containing protein [Polyangiaceae bacterium]